MRKALSQLPPEQAEAWCLRHLNDLSYEQIASEIGVTPNHAGVLLHRARNQLRLLLGDGSQDQIERR